MPPYSSFGGGPILWRPESGSPNLLQVLYIMSKRARQRRFGTSSRIWIFLAPCLGNQWPDMLGEIHRFFASLRMTMSGDCRKTCHAHSPKQSRNQLCRIPRIKGSTLALARLDCSYRAVSRDRRSRALAELKAGRALGSQLYSGEFLPGLLG